MNNVQNINSLSDNIFVSMPHSIRVYDYIAIKHSSPGSFGCTFGLIVAGFFGSKNIFSITFFTGEKHTKQHEFK